MSRVAESRKTQERGAGEAPYRALLEHAADAIVLTDDAGHVRFANPAAALLLGCVSDGPAGAHVFAHVHPDDAERARATLAHATAVPGPTVARTFRFGTSGDSWRRVELVVANALDDPSLRALVVTAREPERRSRGRARHLSVLDELHEIVFRTDADGNWTYLNQAWTDITGFSIEETLGTNFLDYVHPDERDATIALFESVVSGGLPHCRHRTRYLTADRDFRWVEVRSRLLRDDVGRIVGNAGTIADISDRRQAEELLANQTRILELGERRERAEREFVTNAAHELRTPLAAIMSAIEVLQSGAKEVREERDGFLGDIEREADRLSRLVHALLVLARAQTGQEAVKLGPVPVRPLLDEIARSMRPNDGVAVDVVCSPGLAVHGEPDLVEQVFSNLAANAVKHTQRGRIVFTAEAGDDGLVTVRVSDTGRGIPPEDKERVLDRFYRGGERSAEGFGLGLAIVDQAVGALGGTMDVESSPSEGTTVRIALPAAR